jgi:hypothetical protein
MLVSGYAAHDCTISSNLYKQSGNTDTDDSTEPKREVVIEMSGKYNFKVTHEVIETMETESKVIVNWSYDFQILKGSSDKYNLNKDYMKVLHKRFCSSIGTIVRGFMKATITSTSGECTQFYAHSCIQGHQWYNGQLFIFKKSTTKENRLKITIPEKYLDSSLLNENAKL